MDESYHTNLIRSSSCIQSNIFVCLCMFVRVIEQMISFILAARYHSQMINVDRLAYSIS